MALTKMQEKAINGNFGNCLVSASAGSGKTFVMISRVVRLILEGRARVDQFLCVTFTELAARELKQRLSDAISKEIAKTDGEKKEYLLEQLELLPTANVSTIHAFCKNLLTEFFYYAGIDAGFKIIDENESKVLANRAIDRLFEDLYESTDPNIDQILPFYFKKRSDSKLKNAVLDCYDSLICEADPIAILKGGEFYYSEQGVNWCLNAVTEEFKRRASEVQSGAILAVDKLTDKKQRDFASDIAKLLGELLDCESVYEMKDKLGKTKLTKPSLLKTATEAQREGDEIIVAFYKNDFEKFKKMVAEFEIEPLDEEIKKANDLLPTYKAFCFLVQKFMEYYQLEKGQENSLDFSDLEHYTLSLLKNDDVREEIKGRFKYIFTDEYQDTSGVQEAILSSISNDNLFMVGDLKQSIYNFRGCDPQIFARKYKKYSQNEGGIAINLDVNFRSSKPVLQAVNNLFSCVMNERFGGINYSNSPMQFCESYNPDTGAVKMLVIKQNEKESIIPQGVYSVASHVDILSSGNGFAEGKMIAELVNSIVGKEYCDIKTNERKVLDYGDIAILLRSANTKADRYASELIRAGIPISANTKNSIEEYAEVDFAVNLLRVIDSINQDIPLVSTLKSRVGGLDESELMQIRANHKEGSFFDAYYAYMIEQSDALSQKLKEFDLYIKRMQTLAEFLSCDEILTTVIREKGIDSALLCSKMGELKLERLNRLISACSQKKQTVQEFLCGVQKTLESLTVNYSAKNSVQIMSIHASKGLEFPVVILAGTSGGYSTEDLKGEFITDKDFGVALEHKDLNLMQKKPILFRSYLKLLKKKRMQEEELRILYVAMTRAENQLYVTAEYTGEIAPPKNEHGVCDGLYANSFCGVFAKTDFEVQEIDVNDIKSISEAEPKQVLIGEAKEQIASLIGENLDFEYDWLADVKLPVKRSVTQATHQEDDQTEYEYSPIFGESSEEKGTAYHRFLEVCDFYQPVTVQIEALGNSGELSLEQLALIDENRLTEILKMPIFERIKGYNLYKEQPFTALVPASLIKDNYSGEGQILVQGIIDLLAVNGDKAIIVDYKFSTLKTKEHLLKRYEKQLKLYAFAVKKLLNVQIEGVYIANIYSGETVEVK